ncbi:hypothetical protein FOXYSP1_04556 [Fusarium oxysporum f. sp. phaseoli]
MYCPQHHWSYSSFLYLYPSYSYGSITAIAGSLILCKKGVIDSHYSAVDPSVK